MTLIFELLRYYPAGTGGAELINQSISELDI